VQTTEKILHSMINDLFKVLIEKVQQVYASKVSNL